MIDQVLFSYLLEQFAEVVPFFAWELCSRKRTSPACWFWLTQNCILETLGHCGESVWMCLIFLFVRLYKFCCQNRILLPSCCFCCSLVNVLWEAWRRSDVKGERDSERGIEALHALAMVPCTYVSASWLSAPFASQWSPSIQTRAGTCAYKKKAFELDPVKPSNPLPTMPHMEKGRAPEQRRSPVKRSTSCLSTSLEACVWRGLSEDWNGLLCNGKEMWCRLAFEGYCHSSVSEFTTVFHVSPAFFGWGGDGVLCGTHSTDRAP